MATESLIEFLYQERRRIKQQELPPGRFFHPTDVFWDFIQKLVIQKNITRQSNYIIVDVGCGDGSLAKEMRGEGFTAVGIDPAPRFGSVENQVAPCFGQNFNWQPHHIALFCRPSHDGWFEECANIALEKGASVYYVGKSENYDKDLRYSGLKVKKLAEHAGREAERIYKLSL